MVRRGRGREGLSQMCRDMQDLKRWVVKLKNTLTNKRTIQRDVSDEETKHASVDHQGEQEEEHLEHMPFEERMLMSLEGRNDGIKIEVP